MMSLMRLFPVLLPMFATTTLPLLIPLPGSAACQPLARIASNGATRPAGATVCGHEQIALSPGVRSVKLTCLTSRRQVDFPGGVALLACRALKPAKLILCPTNARILCVAPKGDEDAFQAMQDTTQIAWSAVTDATRYQVAISGHGVNWQNTLSGRSINYHDVANLKPGNAYLVKITAYQGETKLTEVEAALNVPIAQLTANSQSR
jgi:hypothetical protein